MANYNLIASPDVTQNYQNGLLPQRNQPSVFYQDTSCRSNLANFSLSSENRRILRKTEPFSYQLVPLTFNLEIQKEIFSWIKTLGWDFPISSVKTIFQNHIFNKLYVWKKDHQTIAYSVCFFNQDISHIAYVFYDPEFSHSDLPIRLVLQAVIDSQAHGLKYCYLGRFSEVTGYYKRTMPGFEYYQNGQWTNYSK